jgi:hypothetical protein
MSDAARDNELSYPHARVRVDRCLKVQDFLTTLASHGEHSGEILNVPALMGPTGCGKTAMARSLAEQYDRPMRAINCGENSDPTDVSGVPVPSMIRKLAVEGTAAEQVEAGEEYMTWVLNRYAAEACSSPVFLFFDDLDKAPPPVQNAMLGITGNRKFRDREIHPRTLLMCAGNRINDDIYANRMSESLRGRVSTVELKPDLNAFVEWGIENKTINPAIIGFLQYRPTYLHKYEDGAARFPTPRGWREASVHFGLFTDPYEDVYQNGKKDNWRQIVAEKCGHPVSKDFWGWYKIVREVDVQEVLKTGRITVGKASASDARTVQFAAIFAVVAELNERGVKKTYTGLNTLFDKDNSSGIDSELRVALTVQLSRQARAQIGTMFPKAANELMEILVRTKAA